ncbi:CRISPR-associated endonuclease Cas1 [Tolypothrix sp. VBCCA 56010]|uniref:CRISPR-associated endonuclease Cas1 n=1 Tax=Tolypothrix sp. VBCCA 56010 TaxID=3137731 RepID=UPI003D7D0412
MSTIYITEHDALLKIQHHYLKVFHQQKQRICIPIRNLSQIIFFSNIHLTQQVIQIVHSHQIPVLYLTQNGEYLGRLENTSQLQPKYLIHQRRHKRDIEFNRATAESMIWAKLHNQHNFLQSWTRNYANPITQRALNYLTLLMDNLPIATSLNQLQEYNQEADNIYHRAISYLLSFYNPCSHTTAKQIAKLQNLGNLLLHQYIYTLLHTAGLHPDYAIFHPNTYELPLVWDFMAEFRAPIVDDLVFNFARNLPNSNGNGNGKKSRTVLQSFLQHWEGKLQTFVLHPYAGEVSYRQCMDLQVREYLACLLGDVEYYRPLAFKHNPAHFNFANVGESQKAPLTLVK